MKNDANVSVLASDHLNGWREQNCSSKNCPPAPQVEDAIKAKAARFKAAGKEVPSKDKLLKYVVHVSPDQRKVFIGDERDTTRGGTRLMSIPRVPPSPPPPPLPRPPFCPCPWRWSNMLTSKVSIAHVGLKHPLSHICSDDLCLPAGVLFCYELHLQDPAAILIMAE